MAMSMRQILTNREDPNSWFDEYWFEDDSCRVFTWSYSNTNPTKTIIEHLPRTYFLDSFEEFWNQDRKDVCWG